MKIGPNTYVLKRFWFFKELFLLFCKIFILSLTIKLCERLKAETIDCTGAQRFLLCYAIIILVRYFGFVAPRSLCSLPFVQVNQKFLKHNHILIATTKYICYFFFGCDWRWKEATSLTSLYCTKWFNKQVLNTQKLFGQK